MYEDDPQDTVFDVLGVAVFGDHPLGRPIIGRAPVIRDTPVDADRRVPRAPLRAGLGRHRGGRLGRPRRDRGAGRAHARRPARGRDALRCPRRRRRCRTRACASSPRTPSRCTSASARPGSRATTSAATPCACSTRSSAGCRRRACSRACARSAGSPTPSTRSPASSPTRARSASTSARGPTTSPRRWRSSAPSSTRLREQPGDRGGAGARARERQGARRAGDGVLVGAHEPARRLDAVRAAAARGRRGHGPRRRRRAGRPARAGRRAVGARAAVGRRASARRRTRSAPPSSRSARPRRPSRHDAPRRRRRRRGAHGAGGVRRGRGGRRPRAGRPRRPGARRRRSTTCSTAATSSSTSRGPDTALDNARAALAAGRHVVIGTTGFDVEALRAAAEGAAANAFVAPNFAIGAVLMMRFAAEASRHMAARRDHRVPPRRPSSTRRRAPRSARPTLMEGDVPIHSVRLPGLVADQDVILGDVAQTLTIRHVTTDRTSFMPGVLLAVRARRRTCPTGSPSGSSGCSGPTGDAVLVAVTDHAAERYRQRVRGTLDARDGDRRARGAGVGGGRGLARAAAGRRGAARLGLRARRRHRLRLPRGPAARRARRGDAVGGGRGRPPSRAASPTRWSARRASGPAPRRTVLHYRAWVSWTRPRRWPSRRRPSSTRRRSSSTRASSRREPRRAGGRVRPARAADRRSRAEADGRRRRTATRSAERRRRRRRRRPPTPGAADAPAPPAPPARRRAQPRRGRAGEDRNHPSYAPPHAHERRPARRLTRTRGAARGPADVPGGVRDCRAMRPYEGLLTAMITPFHADGSVNEEAAVALARHLLANGSHGLVRGRHDGRGRDAHRRRAGPAGRADRRRGRRRRGRSSPARAPTTRATPSS